MSTNKAQLKAKKRKIMGRKVKMLRNEGILPVNLYGKKTKSLALQLPLSDFVKIYKEVGETQLLELIIDGEKSSRHVLVHNVQKEPVKDSLLHADFRQVQLTEKIEAEVPLEIIGESPAIAKGGVLVQQENIIKVESLPTEIPEKFEIDVSKLAEIGDGITLKELKFDKTKVKPIDEDENKLLVKIEAPTKEEEKPVVVETEEGEEGEEGVGEATDGEKKPADDKSDKGKSEGKEDKPADGKKPEELKTDQKAKPAEKK